jgi:hypothetical protein
LSRISNFFLTPGLFLLNLPFSEIQRAFDLFDGDALHGMGVCLSNPHEENLISKIDFIADQKIRGDGPVKNTPIFVYHVDLKNILILTIKIICQDNIYHL